MYVNNTNDQLDATITILLISESAQHISGNLLFLLFCVLIVCTVTLPSGVNPIAVDKYICIFRSVRLWYYSSVVYCPNVIVGWRSRVRWCKLCVWCEGCCL